ncbi:MAG: hypothetical protein A2074_00980 [Candidatus Aquicultor primus]|uniref:GyrI-like small molecule binding domain-containing protein n=1 Tax=Candidatus Aquicultor primus TaxID=1797195 RepID=A0A1F2UTH9_9ACTN|nr:MAG: hypothetical protein A2074_00980 [Candidatus Aquicultor primus]HCG98905.1 hypothetical protein [Actinomycetota bacterium]
MQKIDLKKEFKYLYAPSAKEIVLVEVPEMAYLMVDGKGDPNTSQEYMDSIEALYSIAYTLKFMLKKSDAALDYGVMPLEGLWWVDDMREFSVENKDAWKWTSMIVQPDFVTNEHFEQARTEVRKKKELASIDKVRFERDHEGLSAQTMYIGPYADEGPTIERIHAFIDGLGRKRRGKHHEIYLSDPRRTAPEKLKTVIRQPVE